MDSSHILLRLPLGVRIRIYRFCGLIRSCPIDLNLEGVRRQHRATYFTKTFFCPEHHHCRYPAYSSLPPSLECFCPSMPLHLLLVSHAFYDELFPILFGENQFKVSWQKSDLPDYHLYWLRALSPKAWSFIKSLHIGLTNVVQSGLLPTPNDDPFDTIDSKTVDGGRVIQKWAVLCGDVLSQIPGGRLKFSLGCNVSDTETAIRVTEPLGRLQLMAELAICLNAEPDKNALREVARRAALSLTVKKRKSGTWQMSKCHRDPGMTCPKRFASTSLAIPISLIVIGRLMRLVLRKETDSRSNRANSSQGQKSAVGIAHPRSAFVAVPLGRPHSRPPVYAQPFLALCFALVNYFSPNRSRSSSPEIALS